MNLERGTGKPNVNERHSSDDIEDFRGNTVFSDKTALTVTHCLSATSESWKEFRMNQPNIYSHLVNRLSC